MQSVAYLNGLLTFRSFFNEFLKEHRSGQKQDRKIEQLPGECFALEERAGIPPTTPPWHDGPRVIWGIAPRGNRPTAAGAAAPHRGEDLAIFLIDNHGREAVKCAQTDSNQAEDICPAKFFAPSEPANHRMDVAGKRKEEP